MKKKALLKDTIREIKKSFGRFISIFMIVGIGVAFYAGIKASVPIMKSSADSYFDDYNLMDIKIQSTLGVTKEDANAIKNIKGVESVYASHFFDTLSMKDSQQSVIKVLSFPKNAKKTNSNYMNQYKLVEGRMPKSENECVMETDKISPSGYQLGDTITLTSGTDENLQDTLKHTSYKVVGKVMTPYYVSYEKGTSSIGQGKVSRYIGVWDTNFKSDVYSELYVSITGAKEYNSYQDEYFDFIKPITKQIKQIAKDRADIRLMDVKKIAKDKITAGFDEYQKNKNEFDTSIADAKAQLASGEASLLQGKQLLVQKKQDSELLFVQKELELRNGYASVAQLQTQYDTGMATWTQGQKEYEAQQGEEQLVSLQTNLAQVNETIRMIDAQLATNGLSEEVIAQLQAQRAQAQQAQQQISIALQQLQSKKDQLGKAKSDLDTLSSAIISTKAQLDEGSIQVTTGKETAQVEFQKAQATLDASEQEIKDNKQVLLEKERDGLEKLKEAKESLDAAQKDIEDMKTPKWYVLDRHSHYSYMDYGSAADRMDGIAKVFPVFFYLVAALVCLTTMTRMVDEQRQEIGTLKALGYTKAYIAMKYIAYAGVASIFGGIFGALLGTVIFPTVIYSAWNIMYLLPSVKLHMEIGMAITSIAIASFVTIAAAVFACYKELMETPALLMRPKAPKNGKKIFLERLPFLWKHFNFIHKVTARNIFRYKKRFLMTVIGISGCTALLVAGFGVQDSIGEIVTKQYGEIYNFDMSIAYKEDTKGSQRDLLATKLKKDTNVSSHMEVSVQYGIFKDKGENKNVDVYVVSNAKQFSQFVDLRERIGHKQIAIEEHGAVISEQLAKRKDITVGDTISIDNGQGKRKNVKITDICENYVGHVLYMTSDYYKSIYHTSAKPTGQLVKLKYVNNSLESKLGSTYLKDDAIESVQFYSSIASSFEDTVSSLSFVVVVLIISAGLLAFVVLYNLTNVNISERLREIATIKVLGFYDKEVSAYVYRENMILTIIGGLVGLWLGIALHTLIMDLAELDNVMFGRNINMPSFLYSFLITLAFAIIVNVFMYNKLKKIPMVESLKSIE